MMEIFRRAISYHAMSCTCRIKQSRILYTAWLELGLGGQVSYLLKLYLKHIGLEILMEISLGPGILVHVLMFPVCRPDQNDHKSNHFQAFGFSAPSSIQGQGLETCRSVQKASLTRINGLLSGRVHTFALAVFCFEHVAIKPPSRQIAVSTLKKALSEEQSD